MCRKHEWEDTRDHAVPGRRITDSASTIPIPNKLAPWFKTWRRLVALVAGIITLGGAVGGCTVWLGAKWIGPNARFTEQDLRMSRAELRITANERRLDGLAGLFGSTTTKTCLDAEPSSSERIKMAQAGVPCDSLYRARGLRP